MEDMQIHDQDGLIGKDGSKSSDDSDKILIESVHIKGPTKGQEEDQSGEEDNVQFTDEQEIKIHINGADQGKDVIEDSEEDSDSEDDDDDEVRDRSDWDPLRCIPDDNFIKILAQHLLGSDDPNEDQFRYIDVFEGAYNHVRMFEITWGPSAGTYVVKIPAVGTASRWVEQDAYMLRSEYGTLKLIHERTKCPVPEVIAYDDTLTNVLGAPFIIMKACSGVNAYDIWFDQTINNQDDVENADFPPPDRLRKRVTFLKSLARAMSELQTLSFDKIGILNFDSTNWDGSPTIGPCWHEDMNAYESDDDLCTDKCLRKAPVHTSSRDLWITGLGAKWSHNTTEGGRIMAIEQIMEEIFRLSPFAHSSQPGDEKETFVLRHDDLNFQNVFCDPETGEVTGIIDWERCSTAPRCIGFASLPIFLITDWFPDYNPRTAVHHFWSLEMYRNIYSEAMIAATGTEGDGKYTAKSALYQAAHGALYEGSSGGSIRHFARYVLRQTPGLHGIQDDEFLDWLGDNWDKYGQFVLNRLPQVISPDGSIAGSNV
jgi:aminoglycoside phosphotransferase (APT) family kinase protein